MKEIRRIGIGVDINGNDNPKYYVSVAISDLGRKDIEILCSSEEKDAGSIMALVKSCMFAYRNDSALFTICFNTETAKINDKPYLALRSRLVKALRFKDVGAERKLVAEKRTCIISNVISLSVKPTKAFKVHFPKGLLPKTSSAEYNSGILAVAGIYFQLGELDKIMAEGRIEKLKKLSGKLKGKHLRKEALPSKRKFLSDNDNFGKLLPGLA